MQPEYVPAAGGPGAVGVVSPEPRVAVTFGRPEASPPDEVTLHFTRAPLGMVFAADVMPLIVKYDPSQGQAQELGVRQGWLVMGIDGVDITKMPYAPAFDLFKRRVGALPSQN